MLTILDLGLEEQLSHRYRYKLPEGDSFHNRHFHENPGSDYFETDLAFNMCLLETLQLS